MDVETGRAPLWVVAALLAMALVCAAFAFVGLGVSSYSVDELFTLFLIDHGGGPAEVVRRALTDTHPPAYYLALWGWAQAFGTGEGALRLFSAVCATGALAVFFLGIRGRFSLPACAFALALGAGSKLFFEEAQEVRNYALGLLVSAALLALALAIHRRIREGRTAGWRFWAGLWATGLLAAFIHFYLLLEVGAVHLFLLITARSLRTRGIIVLSGLTILLPVLVYVAALLHGTEQNIQAMWFSNAPGALFKQGLGGLTQAWSQLAIGAVAVLALAAFARRGPAPPTGPLLLCGLVIGGVLAAGLVVSFVLAPSFGRKNLIFLGPFFWMAGAWLYDAAAPDSRRAGGAALIALVLLLTVSNGLTVLTRLTPRNEPWRETAAYVDAVPGCEAKPLPVVLPFLFGPPTPFFRQLAEQRFFGHYDHWPQRLTAYLPREFAPAAAPLALRALLTERVRGQGCRILAWGVHDLDDDSVAAIRKGVAASAGVPEAGVMVKAFNRTKPGLLGTRSPRPNAYVFERAP